MVKKRLKSVLILIILGVALNSFQNRNVDFISSIEAPELRELETNNRPILGRVFVCIQ